MAEDFEKQITQIHDTIAALEAQRGVLDDGVINASIAALQEKLSILEKKDEPPEQQRKLATLLFMDTVGSTRLYNDLDPEVTRDIQDGILKRMADIVLEHGGHVTRFMGDGFMAVFGVPVAKENDPEKAIRAGLEILATAKVISAELKEQHGVEGFQARVGVNTGLVAVGGVTEAGDTVMGAPVNLAARLESAAPAGGLFISHNTYRHVGGLFEVEPQPPVNAKGFDEPIPVYLVKRLKPRAFQMPERGVEGVQIRMIGREIEIHILKDTLHHILQSGEGQVITIIGEAGVGKSRLLAEFLNWVETLSENLVIFLGRSEQEKQSQPYALLLNLFSYHFNIQESDSPEIARGKMERGMVQRISEKAAHIAGQLIGFDFRDSPHLAGIIEDPRQLRDQGIKAIREFFLSIADEHPVLICLEDIHWADDSSLDLINSISQNLQERRLLILFSTRNSLLERRPFWGEGQDFHNRIKLQLLTKWDSRLLVEEILSQVSQLPTALRELVVNGAEGNPFYIEEMIKMLIEQGVVIKGENQPSGSSGWQVEPNQLVQAHVPSTLTGVLQARLDGLPAEEREVLQQASVIGRSFWDQAVGYLYQGFNPDQKQENVASILTSLRNRELVFRRESSSIASTQEYLFKHEMLREVTYESIPLRMRRIYHGLAAEWLLESSGDRVGEYTGQIAEHLELAGRKEKAIDCLLQAGDQAASRFANAEAIWFYKRGLELIQELPESSERDELELELWTALGVPLVIQEGYGADGTSQAYQKAYDLCLSLGKDPSPPALRGLVIAGLVCGKISLSHQYSLQLLEEAEKQGDAILLTEGHYAMGVTSFWQGKLGQSKEHLEIALKFYDPTKQPLHLRRFTQDPRVICLVRLGLTLWFLGFPEQAKYKVEESIAYARELGHPFSLIYALNFAQTLYTMVPDDRSAHRYGQEAIQLGEEHQVHLGFTNTKLVDTWVMEKAEAKEATIQLFLNEMSTSSPNRQLELVRPSFCTMLAELLDRAGRTEEGFTIVKEAFERADQQGLGWYQAELLRSMGELILKMPDRQTTPEKYFMQAIQLAQNQHALSLELRAALSLGQLWRSQGKGEAARELVREIYAKFTEGFDTPDLEKAKYFIQ
jgi:class 3 adenylate cyclase/predicted ATPase